MTIERKFIEETAKCLNLLDMAIDKHNMQIKDPSLITQQSREEVSGLMIVARNCTITKLRSLQKEIGLKDEDLLSIFQKNF